MIDKTCTKCNTNKDLSEFNKSGIRNNKQNYYAQCKECIKITRRNSYLKHRDRVLSKNKKYSRSERGKKVKRLYGNRISDKLSDVYLKSLITRECNLTYNDIPQDLLKIYRDHLIIKRKLNLTQYGKNRNK